MRKSLQNFFLKFLGKKEKTICGITHGKQWTVNKGGDFIRLGTLELISNEIKRKNVKGEIAELGVYKGEFAKVINQLFPDKKLYLFDTFSGFDEKDMTIELGKKLFHTNKTGHLSDTSVENVRKNLPHQDKAIFKVGYFPESAKGLTEDFSFVSLDADLYQPTIEGLRFFYPRLSSGGYIMVHDYSSSRYDGASQAVIDFCKEANTTIIPIPDSGGTAIFCKF